MKKILFLLLAIVILAVPFGVSADTHEYTAYDFLAEFVEACPSRVAGTDGETEAAAFLADKFAQIGFTDVTLDDFTFTDLDDALKNSQNVVAKYHSEQSLGTIIVGAHYDNVRVGEGANDNGSGVAVMLDIASRLVGQSLAYDVVFIAFGAEEQGFFGSQSYVADMKSAEKQNVLLMVNIDSVAMGDKVYFFGEDKATALNAKMTELANGLGYSQKAYEKPLWKDLNVLPIADGTIPYYHTGYASDNIYFRIAGIPTEFIFSGNFDTGLTVYTQSEREELRNMHTTADTLETLNKLFGDEAKQNMQIASDTVVNVLTNADFEAIILNARSELADKIFWETWPAFLIYLGILLLFEIFGYLYLRYLKKQDILKANKVNKEKVFEAPDIEDIYTFLKK